MDKSEIGKADPFPDVPRERFGYLPLINQRYFVQDYPARLRPVFDKDIATLFRVEAGKGP